MANAKPDEGVYFEEEDDEGEAGKKPGKPCEGSRRELIKCLKESDCIKVGDQLDSTWVGVEHFLSPPTFAGNLIKH